MRIVAGVCGLLVGLLVGGAYGIVVHGPPPADPQLAEWHGQKVATDALAIAVTCGFPVAASILRLAGRHNDESEVKTQLTEFRPVVSFAGGAMMIGCRVLGRNGNWAFSPQDYLSLLVGTVMLIVAARQVWQLGKRSSEADRRRREGTRPWTEGAHRN